MEAAYYYDSKSKADVEKLLEDEFLRRTPQWDNRPYDRTAMQEQMAQPLAVRRRTGLPLYCGEFACYHEAPLPIRLA